MDDEIKVSVASYGEGHCLMMTYKDPIMGKEVAKTSGETDRTKADRADVLADYLGLELVRKRKAK